MLKLKYSYIGDLMPKLRPILDRFSLENNLDIDLVHLDWENAWHEILGWSLYGQYGEGPGISHIGATWSASLVGMESLRLFKPEEVRQIGDENFFLPHSWQSGISSNHDKIWSLPWLSYTYLLVYRRDLLEQAGVDEGTAFQNAESLNETIARLREKIDESPWVVPVSLNHLDTLHYIASWVWGAGGDFFTPDNLDVAFLEPAALQGIYSYYHLLRSMNLASVPLNKANAQDIFTDGRAAVTIMGADNAYHWLLGQQATPDMQKKIGFAPIPGISWVGGDNIVIWKNALVSVELERAAVALAQYLIGLETQRAFAQGEIVHLPTSPQAFDALPMQNTQLTNSVIYSLLNGRSYRPMNTWAKIEFQFAHVFGQIGAEILAGADVVGTVRKNLEPHAKWLEIVLK